MMSVEEILARAHKIRHDGIRLENAGRLLEAEEKYDEALRLYREHDKTDSLNYANAVRYPAVIKNLLGKREESAVLWKEAHERYERLGIIEGAAGSAVWLTIFAIERKDHDDARVWFEKASTASSKSNDPDTHKFVERARLLLEQGCG